MGHVNFATCKKDERKNENLKTRVSGFQVVNLLV